MMYSLDKNGNLYQNSVDTHVPEGMGTKIPVVHESSVNFSREQVTQNMLRMQKQAKANAWNAVQSASAALNNAAKKKNYEKAVRAQVLGREAQPAMTREEALIKKEIMRQKMHGADFSETDEIPGQSYSAGVHSVADYNQVRPVNPSYAQIPTNSSGSATVTDWPKRYPTQFWNQPVNPPSNVQLKQSAYKAAMGLGDYYDEVSDGLLESEVQFAAQQLAQTTPKTVVGATPSYEITPLSPAPVPSGSLYPGVSLASNEVSPLTPGPMQVMNTLFPGVIVLPVLGPVPQVNIVYTGIALFGLGILSRLKS
jgi:hypothetical protein